MAHELCHWKQSHLVKSSLTDTLYMVLFGCLLSLVLNKPNFLAAFGFHETSFFVSLGLFTWLYTVTLHQWILILIHKQSRLHEHQADEYAVKLGYGVSLQSALIRSYASNKDNLFNSWIDQLLIGSHPTLHERLAEIKDLMD